MAGNPTGTEEDGPFDDSFVADKEKIWDLISPIIIKIEAWTHIKHARTSRGGINAILAFHDKFLGTNKVDHIQMQIGQKLLSLSY